MIFLSDAWRRWKHRRLSPAAPPAPPILEVPDFRKDAAAKLRRFVADARAALAAAPFEFDPIAFDARRRALPADAAHALVRIEMAARYAEAGVGSGYWETLVDRWTVHWALEDIRLHSASSEDDQ